MHKDDALITKRTSIRASAAVVLAGLLMSGCATVQVIRSHPQQEHLERLVATILPHTGHPEVHYWVRIAKPTEDRVDLWVLPQQHIYLSDSLVQQADDRVLTALLAHGIAHHELGHHGKRNFIQTLQYWAFQIGGWFVPFLGFGTFAAMPVLEAGMSFTQEFSADAKAVTYLQPLGYSTEDYIRALQFLANHHRAERSGDLLTTQDEFSSRIAQLRRRQPSQDVLAQGQVITQKVTEPEHHDKAIEQGQPPSAQEEPPSP